MINRQAKLSIVKQSELLAISRSTVYYQPKEICEADLLMMRAIDRLHTDFPFMGSRMLRDQLQRQGHQIGRQHTRTLMR